MSAQVSAGKRDPHVSAYVLAHAKHSSAHMLHICAAKWEVFRLVEYSA